jgi:hypothetical protein
MQETRRFKPSTVSRRTSLVTGFYRTCVIDGVLDHSPAEYVRRPTVPAESLTLGLTHPQFEAMLTVARESTNCNDFALVAMLGLLGLRIFEAAGSNVEDLGGGARPPGAARSRQGHQSGPGAAPASRREGDRPGRRAPGHWPDPAQRPWSGPPDLHSPRPGGACSSRPSNPRCTTTACSCHMSDWPLH